MTYEVKTIFCDGTSSKQIHYEVDAGCGVYALRLGDMLTKRVHKSTATEGKETHIVEVQLISVSGSTVLLVSSGEFPCEHEEEVPA